MGEGSPAAASPAPASGEQESGSRAEALKQEASDMFRYGGSLRMSEATNQGVLTALQGLADALTGWIQSSGIQRDSLMGTFKAL